MKHFGIIFAIILIVLAVVLTGANDEGDMSIDMPDAMVEEMVPTAEQGDDAQAGDTMEAPEQGDAMEEMPLDGVAGNVKEGSTISYTIAKEFFDKPTETVTAVAPITGDIVVDTETNMIEGMLLVSGGVFDSGNAARDNHMAGLLGDVVITIPATALVNGTFSGDVIVDVVAGGVTQAVPVTVDVAIGDTITVTGSATLTPSAFIELPSAAGVYGVADTMDITFAVEA